MALVRTTLSSAVTVTDTQISVASATTVAPDRFIRVDNEMMRVQKGYVSGVTVPVLRGVNGTKTDAHVTGAAAVHGLPSDFDEPAQGGPVITYQSQRARKVISITATTSTLTGLEAGCDTVVILNGTAAITLTVPIPTVEMDGDFLYITGNGVAQHVLTFTGGIGGAGSGYTLLTINASAPTAFSFVAVNAVWEIMGGIISSGTTTKIAAVVS